MWINRLWPLLAAILISVPAAAHMTLNSQVNLTIGSAQVHAEIIIPQSEYAAATALSIGNDRASRARAEQYIAEHFSVYAADGQAWTVRMSSVEFVQLDDGPADVRATAVLTPPAGASARKFAVEWRALIAALPNHSAMFVIQRDIAGAMGNRPQIVGAARAGANRIAIDAGDASTWRELRNAAQLGVDHIVEGYDHLIFLIALLLAAPLVAKDGRWSAARGLRSSIRRTIGLVTAFTIGHCLTLVGATVANGSFPAQPIEVIIAISVFVSAAHAARPIFPTHEPAVAAGFGLVHGLAFATLVSDLNPTKEVTPVALIGFNLGIEIVQVAIVVVVMPALIGLARYPSYRLIRLGVAFAGMAAATAWIFDRAFGLGGDAAVLANQLIAGVTVALLTICAASTLIFVLGRRKTAPLWSR